nr:MAG TPA: hypothetical protein [Caudoviricetes sp.]
MTNINYKNIYLYDHDFGIKGIIDEYISMIWTERYNDVGDCEIVVPMNSPFAEQIKLGDYVELVEESDAFNFCRNIMMIDYIDAKNDMENHHIVFKGQDQTRLLKQRIIPLDYEISTGENYIDKIITIINNGITQQREYFIKTFGLVDYTNQLNVPLDIRIKIPDYWEKYPYTSSGFPFYKKCDTKSVLLHAGTVFDSIKAICDICHWGFRVSMDDDNKYVLYIYCGKRHDGTEIHENPMIFSMDFDNLVSSELIIDAQSFSNTYFIMGDKYDAPDYDTINDDKKSFKRNQKVSRHGVVYESVVDGNTHEPSEGSSFWRRIPWRPFTLTYDALWPGKKSDDSSSIPSVDMYDNLTTININDYYEPDSSNSNSDNRIYISNADMVDKLRKEFINNNNNDKLWKKTYNPEIYVSDKYVYKKDYSLGDLITYLDKFAGTFSGRVVSFTRTLDSQGYREFPTINIE